MPAPQTLIMVVDNRVQTDDAGQPYRDVGVAIVTKSYEVAMRAFLDAQRELASNEEITQPNLGIHANGGLIGDSLVVVNAGQGHDLVRSVIAKHVTTIERLYSSLTAAAVRNAVPYHDNHADQAQFADGGPLPTANEVGKD